MNVRLIRVRIDQGEWVENLARGLNSPPPLNRTMEPILLLVFLMLQMDIVSVHRYGRP